MPYDFFSHLGNNERVPYFQLRFARGCQLLIQYNSAQPVWFNTKGELTISAGSLVIKARLGEPLSEEVEPSAGGQAVTIDGAEDYPEFHAPPLDEEDSIPTPDGPPDEDGIPAPDGPPDAEGGPAAAPETFQGESTGVGLSAEDEGDPFAGIVLFKARSPAPAPAPAPPAPGPAPALAEDRKAVPPVPPSPPAAAPAQAAPAASLTEPEVPADPPETLGTEQSLESFLHHFQFQRVTEIYHLPEAGFFVEVWQVGKKGALEPFQP